MKKICECGHNVEEHTRSMDRPCFADVSLNDDEHIFCKCKKFKEVKK